MSAEDQSRKTQETDLQGNAQDSGEGNGLTPLYWLVGAVAMIVLLTWLGSEG